MQDLLGIKKYLDLSKLNAKSYIITEDNAAVGQTAEEYVSFFEKMYADIKAPFFDKQILIGTAKDNYSVYDRTFQQDVKIEQVINGNTNLEGQVLPMMFSGGFYYETPAERDNRVSHSIFYSQKLSKDDTSQQFVFDMAGLNIMKPGHSYLVFAQSLCFDDYTIICADKHQYTWFDLSDTKTSVVKNNVMSDNSENEIFTDSQIVIDDFYKLKKEVLDYYGINSSDD